MGEEGIRNPFPSDRLGPDGSQSAFFGRGYIQRENPIASRFHDELLRLTALAAKDSRAQMDYFQFPEPNFDGAYLLMAYAIENLLKGLIVAKKLVVFKHHELPKNLKSHDLHRLHIWAAPKATLPRHVLDGLTYMSEWRARYPLPMTVADFWPMRADGAWTAGAIGPQSHIEMLTYCDALQEQINEVLTTP
jgi:hypothetical protein